MNVVRLKVDPTKRIAAIAMRESGDDLTGIRLVDDEGNFILDYTWSRRGNESDWNM